MNLSSAPKLVRIQSHATHFCILGLGHIFGADNARHFTFGQQIGRNEYCPLADLGFLEGVTL